MVFVCLFRCLGGDVLNISTSPKTTHYFPETPKNPSVSLARLTLAGPTQK